MVESKQTIGCRLVVFNVICPLLCFLFRADAARIARCTGEEGMPWRMASEVIHQTSGTWCVAQSDASVADLQDALDWVCGQEITQGNVDCTPIEEGGSCYNPDTVAAHASYAFNAYFQKSNQASGSCNFNGAAETTTKDPSSGTCTYPPNNSLISTNITSSSPFGNSGTTTSGIGPRVTVHFYSTLSFAFLAMVASSKL